MNAMILIIWLGKANANSIESMQQNSMNCKKYVPNSCFQMNKISTIISMDELSEIQKISKTNNNINYCDTVCLYRKVFIVAGVSFNS